MHSDKLLVDLIGKAATPGQTPDYSEATRKVLVTTSVLM